MPILAFVAAVAAAIPWAAAAIIGRIAGAPPGMMPILISGGSFIACLPTVLFVNRAEIQWHGQIRLALLAGVLNGIGMAIAWSILVGGANQGKWELATVMPITYTLLFLFIALGTCIFAGETITAKQIMGMCLAGGAIYLMRG